MRCKYVFQLLIIIVFQLLYNIGSAQVGLLISNKNKHVSQL